MSDYKLVRSQTVRFLLGEEGSFERPPGEGRFWWRNVLLNGIVGYHEADIEQVDALQSELTAAKAENEALRGRADQAEQTCRDRIKADRLYCLKHGDEFAQSMARRLEQAEARVAELESQLHRYPAGIGAYILRKQAEALESEANDWEDDKTRQVAEDIRDSAQRLHQQADELERD